MGYLLPNDHDKISNQMTYHAKVYLIVSESSIMNGF